MSKYKPLWKYLKMYGQDVYVLSYADIKDVLGFDLDHAFLNYEKEAKDFGYEVGKNSLKNKTVMFQKI